MPFLSDEEVLRFNTEIDELEQKRSKLDKLNDIYVRDLKVKKSQLRKSIIAGLVLLFCLFTSLLIHVFSDKETSNNENIEVSVNEAESLLTKEIVEPKEDVVIEETSVFPIEQEKVTEVEQNVKQEFVEVYGVQIGAFYDYDIDYTLSIKRIRKGSLNKYIIAGFSEEHEAEKLKLFLNENGLKDAYVVELGEE